MSRTVRALTIMLAVSACAKKEQPAPPPPTVVVAPPLQRDVVNWDEYIGHFEAPQSVDLRARVTGVVTRIYFRDGQTVKAGQPLFEIDPRPYRAALQQAEAQIASSQAALINARSVEARTAKLLSTQAVSREEYENNQAQTRTAAANLQSARASAYNAKLNLDFTQVRSPVSGRVSNRRVSLGDQVTNGDTLLTTVVSLDPIWFTFDAAESFFLNYTREAATGSRPSSRVKPNPIDIQLSDETGYNWHGKMAFVDNAVDPGSGTIRAYAEVANPTGFLTPGLFGRARLIGSGTYHAMLVPDESISTDQSRKVVMVVGQDGKTAQRVVELGAPVVGLRAIRSGLAPTDRVVISGLGMLQPGTQVTVKQGKIVPKSKDTGPQPPAVTLPQPASATFPGQPG